MIKGQLSAKNIFGILLLVTCAPLISAEFTVLDLLLGEFKENSAQFQETLLEMAISQPKQKDSRGRTGLMFAAATGNHEIIRTILQNYSSDQRQASLLETDNNGSTPLIIAARYGRASAIKTLLNFFPDGPPKLGYITQENMLKMNAIDAVAFTKPSLEDPFLSHDMDDVACRQERGCAAETLLQALPKRCRQKCANKTFDLEGISQSLLMGAAKLDYPHVVKALLRAGADQEYRNAQGFTPLCYAIINKKEAAGRALLERGVQGENLLVEAAASQLENNAEHIKFMICKLEINVNPRFQGYTPLTIAARNGNTAHVRALLECGADKTIPNEEGHTAQEIAQSLGYQEIVELLN